MADTTHALQGDTVDTIARRIYGDESGYVERLLEANPGLAALGPVLPLGTRIDLPDVEKTDAPVGVVTLWD